MKEDNFSIRAKETQRKKQISKDIVKMLESTKKK